MKHFQDLTQLPLHEILLCNGFVIDRNKSSARNPVLKNENERIVITKRGDNFLYFNTDGSNDRGNIITFCRNRDVNIKVLIRNYENGKNDLEPLQIPKYFNSETNEKEIVQKYHQMNDYNPQKNDFFINRGIYDSTIKNYADKFKQDQYGDICFPHYKLKTIMVGKEEKSNILICGYTKRLKYPLYKNADGSIKDKPLKNIHYGKKGLEILNPAINSKEIKKIVITESMVDCLSFMQLFPNYDPKETMLISTAGDFNFENGVKPTINKILKLINPDARIIIGFDNDKKGQEFSKTIEKYVLETTKKSAIIYKPFCKDLNDDLRLAQIISKEYLNSEKLNDFLEKKLNTYKRSSDTQVRKNILETFRKIDKYKPLSQEIKDAFNTISKHKAIKEL